MKLGFGKLVAGVALGALLVFAPAGVNFAAAGPFGAVQAINEANVLPLENVQARRQTRRAPQRNVRRRGGNNALAAGALIGAAILGGAIIANSQTRHRPAPQYYVTPEGYYVDAYGRPVGRPQPVYQQQYEYYEQPVYQAPRQRYRQPIYQHVEGPAPVQGQPGQVFRQGNQQLQIIHTPDKETPYTYVPVGPQQPQRRRGLF